MSSGESGRCIMEFSATPATFCNIEIKKKKKGNELHETVALAFQVKFFRHPLFVSPVLLPHLLPWSLQLLAITLLNPAVKYAHSHVRGTINKTERR